MLHTDLFSERFVRQEPTEDGDYLSIFEVRAKGFEGVRAYNKAMAEGIDPVTGCHGGQIFTWTGAGDGWLKATFCHLVDAYVVHQERHVNWDNYPDGF